MAHDYGRINLDGLLDEDIEDLPPEQIVVAFTALKRRLLENEEIIDRLNLTVQALLATLLEHGSWDADYYRRALASHDILDGKWDGKLQSDRMDMQD